MAEIGSTLRDTRIRKKIDIAQVEADIKIRAKYLRALENDEFDVLPGPAYVGSFLRTYAEYLGLDATLLVEEYRVRHETRADTEYPHFAEPPTFRARRAHRARPPSRRTAIAVIAALLVGFLLVLGLTAKEGGQPSPDKRTATKQRTPKAGGKSTRRSAAPKPGGPASPAKSVTRLVVRAQQDVWVCLVDAAGRRRIDAVTLSGGSERGPYRSKGFSATFGNGYVSVNVDGEARTVRDTPNPVGYRITPAGLTLLPEARRPTCT